MQGLDAETTTMKGIEAKILYIRNKYDKKVCKVISEIRIGM